MAEGKLNTALADYAVLGKENSGNNPLGLAYGLGAFVLWGLMPIFIKQLRHLPLFELLSQRILWSFLFLTFLLCFRRTLSHFVQEIRQIFSDWKTTVLLLLSALLLSSNWLVYIWAIEHNVVLEISLGYFINPLMNVAIGVVLMGERLNRIKFLAIMLTLFGVFFMIFDRGIVPWVALFIASSFAFYGVVHKKVKIGAIMGLWLEMLIFLPLALIYLTTVKEGRMMDYDNFTITMLVIGGGVTAVPLLLFALAVKKLPLTTLGLIQYMTPSLMMLIAVFLWHEPFTTTHLVTFSFIWSGLGLYTASIFFLRKKAKMLARKLKSDQESEVKATSV